MQPFSGADRVLVASRTSVTPDEVEFVLPPEACSYEMMIKTELAASNQFGLAGPHVTIVRREKRRYGRDSSFPEEHVLVIRVRRIARIVAAERGGDGGWVIVVARLLQSIIMLMMIGGLLFILYALVTSPSM